MERSVLPICFPERGGGGHEVLCQNDTGASASAGKSDHIEFDDDIKGFGLRLREGGSRVWIYQYRIDSKQRRVVLGSATSVPLSVARKNAGELEARVKLGGDPATDKGLRDRAPMKRSVFCSISI